VRGYVNLNLFKRDVLVLMGSASFRLRRFAGAFPGRRGAGRAVEVLPLSFPEYLSVHGVEAKKGESRVLALREGCLATGGYPRSVKGDEEYAWDLVASVEKDAVKAGEKLEAAEDSRSRGAERGARAISLQRDRRQSGSLAQRRPRLRKADGGLVPRGRSLRKAGREGAL